MFMPNEAIACATNDYILPVSNTGRLAMFYCRLFVFNDMELVFEKWIVLYIQFWGSDNQLKWHVWQYEIDIATSLL